MNQYTTKDSPSALYSLQATGLLSTAAQQQPEHEFTLPDQSEIQRQQQHQPDLLTSIGQPSSLSDFSNKKSSFESPLLSKSNMASSASQSALQHALFTRPGNGVNSHLLSAATPNEKSSSGQNPSSELNVTSSPTPARIMKSRVNLLDPIIDESIPATQSTFSTTNSGFKRVNARKKATAASKIRKETTKPKLQNSKIAAKQAVSRKISTPPTVLVDTAVPIISPTTINIVDDTLDSSARPAEKSMTSYSASSGFKHSMDGESIPTSLPSQVPVVDYEEPVLSSLSADTLFSSFKAEDSFAWAKRLAFEAVEAKRQFQTALIKLSMAEASWDKLIRNHIQYTENEPSDREFLSTLSNQSNERLYSPNTMMTAFS